MGSRHIWITEILPYQISGGKIVKIVQIDQQTTEFNPPSKKKHGNPSKCLPYQVFSEWVSLWVTPKLESSLASNNKKYKNNFQL